MLFNSREFALFFPAAVLLHFLVPRRAQVLMLVLAGALFYSAFLPAYLLVLLALILVDYAAGIWIAARAGRSRRAALGLSLAANLGLLFAFKYYGFARASLAALLPGAALLPAPQLLLPIGLSFHTFQSMAYTIEVYRGTQPPERSLVHFAAYVLFFPQLVAGPIERPGHLLPQLHREHAYRHEDAVDGLLTMAWGFFKKVVIADRLAPLVNFVYRDPAEFSGLPLLMATALFSYQIYFDFSGYSDIAVGAARVLGYRLVTNFERPYAAASIAEFWRRWHISLSTWFRDYVYIPLGGNRHGSAVRCRALLATFLLSGLWHGAAWTFVAWGALHGAYLLASLASASLRGRLAEAAGLARLPHLRRAWGVACTFALVSAAWAFFRAASLSDAWHVLSRGVLGLPESCTRLATFGFEPAAFAEAGVSRSGLLLTLAAVLATEAADRLRGRRSIAEMMEGLPAAPRWAAYYALLAALLVLGRYQESPFIYFQF